MASAALKDGTISWRSVRGRNGWDAPSILPDDIATEAVNVRLIRGKLPQKRYGSVEQTFTGDTFSGYNQLIRFVPGQNDAAAEMFIVDRTGTTKILRVAAGSAADELTLLDAVSSRPQDVTSAVLNGKLYLCYDSTVNRLHVFDPALSTTDVRRAGLVPPAAATVANQGSGTYPAQLRYYKIAWRVKVGSTIQRQSELGASVSFTPSGSGLSARVTKPAASSPAEGETHWVVFGSFDDTVYYELSEIAVGTTTYDDTADPDDYDDNDASPAVGAYTPAPSAKFIISTGERLVMFGAYETATGDSMPPKNGRVWFTPVLDTSDADDDERVSNTLTFQGWIDIGRNSGAEDRALVGPMDNQIFAIQSRGFVMLVPTEDAQRPYKRVALNSNVGAVSHWSSFIGEDEMGRPCVYWLDPLKGPYRYGYGGFQWLGYEIQDVWATFNPAAANRTAHGVFDQDQKICKWWIATGSADDPDTLLVYHVQEGRVAGNADEVRGGWTVDTGTNLCTARCSAMLPATVGATMSRKLKPYAGFVAKLLRTDDSTVTADDSTTFQAYVTSKALDVGRLHQNKTIGKAYLQAAAASGVTIRQTLIRNYGDETSRTADALLTAAGSETRVLKKYEDADLTEWFAMQVRLGDSAAVSNNWTLDEWTCTVQVRNER